MTRQLTMTQSSIKSFIESEKDRLDNGLGNDGIFEYVACQQILKPYGIDDDETERGLTGGGNDGGYDGIYVFLNETLVSGEDPDILDIPNKAEVDIHFIQAKNSPGFSESVFDKWNSSFRNLLEDEDGDPERYSSNVIDAFRLIRSILTKAVVLKLRVTISFWVVSLGEEVHPNTKKALEDCKSKTIPSVPGNVVVNFQFVTASNLFELIMRQPDETQTLTGTKEPLCPDESSAIITVSLRDYNLFISTPNGQLNKTLFEANIRDYQGRTAVNKAIEETLEKEQDIDFWWLNNGVTIVADSVTRDMSHSLTLLNPRIVNGLQTSNMIKRYCDSNSILDDQRKVLVKCIASNDQAVRARIIAATNKQTSIPPAYLRSLESIHLKIERYFLEHGLHYDRRKTSCKNKGIKPKDIISVPFLGQCLIATLLQQPDYARARPAQILSDDEKYSRIFNESIPLDSYLALGSLAVSVRQWLKESEYDRAVQNDILFYLLLMVCVEQAKRFEITSDDLMDISIPSSSTMEEAADKIYRTYADLGATAAIAKNKSLTQRLREQFEN